ncbi:MAG: 4-hydroxyphenylacetate 3-hydroxylase N-terminal domain-containing protein [Paracoccaceae bacterium]
MDYAAVRADDKRPFTGAEYLESLRDGREVYVYGERVDDVTTHPAFRNSVRSTARLYDALHANETKDLLCAPTDTGNGGYTHKFFKVAHSSEDLFAQRDAIAGWSRLSYGWMGRSPDYKAALMNTLGANAEFYGDFADNARAWHKKCQEAVFYLNHAIVNPPIDRDKPSSEVRDVYLSCEGETDAGIIVSGAKVVATNSALTHYNFLAQNMSGEIDHEDFACMFIAAMDSPGVKLFCRASYEKVAAETGTPFDYPLSSRFDENDAIIVFDKVLIPWENVLVYKDLDKLKAFYPRSGFFNGFTFQACTRLAVKLDFMAGLLHRALEASGTMAFRGVQTQLGEVINWRNTFWALSDSMAGTPQPWVNGAVLPNGQTSSAYRMLATEAWPRVKEIVQQVVASGLIYLPSSAKDFANPDVDRYLKQYVRGSNGIDYKERIKIMKLLWDAVGSEFGGRHELYERNYAGSNEMVRFQALFQAQGSGSLAKMTDFANQCMADYDETGWLVDGYQTSH